MTFEDIEKVNAGLPTVDIKGKEYVDVPSRVQAFRKLFPDGCIDTEIVNLEDGVVTIRATCYDGNGKKLSTGLAQEKESSSFINKTSFIENCETSAVGRAIGFIGIGSTRSMASAEEVANAIQNQEKEGEREKLVSVICSLAQGDMDRIDSFAQRLFEMKFDSLTVPQLRTMKERIARQIEAENKVTAMGGVKVTQIQGTKK